jgi:DMSO/TMAO reductase YedYZ molybdopterin-dependent catalytic subunit
MDVKAGRRLAGIGGAVAVAVALGVGELLGGTLSGVHSPLAAVGARVVDVVPPIVEDVAIGLFGTANKAALAVGTTVIALTLGWWTGIAAARRRAAGPAVFAAFGALGIAAGLAEPLVTPWEVIAAGIVAPAAGAGVLAALLDAASLADEPTDGVPGDRARRRFLGLAAAGAAAAAVSGTVGRILVARVPPPVSTVGSPTVTTLPVADLVGRGHDLAVPDVTPIVTPNDRFFRIDTALVVPSIDPAAWELRVTGMVDREVRVGYDDLLAMDHVDRYVTIACVSNEVGGDLIGNALWTGPLLADLLDRAGIRSGATQLVGRAVDGWTAGFPTPLALDDREAMIAVAMNGEPLPRRHGYPARLIVPGLYGYVSATKWVTEIELTRWEDFDAYWVPRGWAKEAPIKLQSRIDRPRTGATVAPGEVVAGGVAWAPTRGISAVEVAVDGGSWEPAEISVPLSDAAWVQWAVTVHLDPGAHILKVRAVDGVGEVQTDRVQLPRPDGATGHHWVRVVAR